MYSEHPGKEFGKFVRTAGKFFNDENEDKGNLLNGSRKCNREVRLMRLMKDTSGLSDSEHLLITATSVDAFARI